MLVWYVGLNAQLGHLFVMTGSAARPPDLPPSMYVQSHPDNGSVVRDFFAELARREAENGSREGIYLSVDKVNDWPITVDTRRPVP